LIFCTGLQSFAKGFGQEAINLQLQNARLKEALKAIESQGTYRFVYKDQILPKGQRITINVQNATLEDVLSNIFQNTDLTYRQLNSKLVVITEEKKEETEALSDVPVSGKITAVNPWKVFLFWKKEQTMGHLQVQMVLFRSM
jgi:hypothetical protein